MAYNRRNVADGSTVMNADLYNNLQDGIDENANMCDQALAIIKGRNQALAYDSYSEMITTLNSMGADELKRGQNIYIGTVGVPDLWVYGVETSSVTYTYVDDLTFVQNLDTNTTVQVGYYKLAQLETQKVDLVEINTGISDLQSDVGTLKTNVNTLMNKGCDNLLWNISDEIFTEKTVLDIPEQNVDSSVTIDNFDDIAFYDDKVILCAYYSSRNTLFIYDGSTWSVKIINSINSPYFKRMLYYNGFIYLYTKNSTSFVVAKTNINTLNSESIFSYSNGNYNSGDILIHNNILYIVCKTTSYYLTIEEINLIGGTNKTTEKIYYADFNTADKVIGLFIKNNLLYIYLSSGIYTVINLENYTTIGTFRSLFNISNNDYIYPKILNIYGNMYYFSRSSGLLCKSNDYSVCQNDVLNNFVCAYNNEIYTYNSLGSVPFYKLKPYRVATSYATKGTKIYLPNTHKPLTDNLQAIDNGYEVTESGEVKIKLYE